MSPNTERLRNALEQSAKTRAQISRECGVSEAHLSRFVHGERGLTVETAERLADCLGLELVLRQKTKRRKS